MKSRAQEYMLLYILITMYAIQTFIHPIPLLMGLVQSQCQTRIAFKHKAQPASQTHTFSKSRIHGYMLLYRCLCPQACAVLLNLE